MKLALDFNDNLAISMAALFEHFGICFSYPENWSVEVLEDPPDTPTILVASPATAFWQLSKYSVNAQLESLFDEALSALRSEYHQIEVEPERSTVDGIALDGYLVNFFYLDLVTTCLLRAFKTETDAYFLVCQAEDREFKEVTNVFEAMLASLLRNL